jgi:hypothetical protein
MASTPLYKFLKSNGTTFYAFPGAAEDISAAYQNANYKMYFSKYTLLNFPKQNLTPGTQSNPIHFDFENSFFRSSNANPTTNFSDGIVESLRNYVANHEVSLRESRLNNTQYYYDTNALETTTEKIFWKWCKKLNLIDFEPAIPQDEYFSTLTEFASRSFNDDEYFPEYLWKEREIVDWDTVAFYQTGQSGYTIPPKLEIEFPGTTNFKVGDIINIFNVSDSSIYNMSYGGVFGLSGSQTIEGIYTSVLKVIPAGATQGQKIIVDIDTTLGYTPETTGQARIVYHRLVQYIGEVNGVSNVNEANRSYTEVYAHIPDHTGQTPDILFRTMIDVNYKPNMTYPVIPSQYQPEIVGAEFFNSPIVNTPQNYPGSYLGFFDTLDFTYTTSNGDDLRRSGNYFGVSGDINNPVVDGGTIDGISVDFNTSHYVKMNIPGRVVTNFDQFNALTVNNEPPTGFEFNAILWYYTVEDNNGNQKTNLYGVSFLDHPDNNIVEEENGLRFPTYKKLVSNGEQDGTSYAFSLNLNFNIINENTPDTYNPQAINSLFSMNLFNEAMSRLSSTNDSFFNIIAEQSIIKEQINNLSGLLYTQTDINTLNARMQNLENLLRLYATNQIVGTDTIEVSTLPGTPPLVSISSIDRAYGRIDNFLSTQFYNAQGVVPNTVAVPLNKDFLINLLNNDEVELALPNNEKLTLVLDTDLYDRQSCEILITANEFASQNKRLDIYMNSNVSGGLNQVLLVGDIDLPVYYNTITQLQNSAYLWKDFSFDIDFTQPITYLTGDLLEVPLEGNTQIIYNSIKAGDALYLNNLFVGTASVYDFSGQYIVDNVVSPTSSYIKLDISNNANFVAYGASQSGLTSSQTFTIHGTSSTSLSNLPYFSLNKGKKVKITKVSNSNVLSERYKVQIDDIM